MPLSAKELKRAIEIANNFPAYVADCIQDGLADHGDSADVFLQSALETYCDLEEIEKEIETREAEEEIEAQIKSAKE